MIIVVQPWQVLVAALANLGHDISDQSVGNILKANGVEPVPQGKRNTTWKTFIKAHWEVLAAVDFTTVEVWTTSGLVTYFLLFVMELKCSNQNSSACSLGLTRSHVVECYRLAAATIGRHRNCPRGII